MALEVRQLDHPGDDVQQVDGKWAATGGYYFNWLWGFDTEADARLVAEAIEDSANNSAEACMSS